MSIKLIVLDVDGTLTDGSIIYSSNGDDIKSFSVKDGLGIECWVKLGGEVAIITGRESVIIARRAKELKIKYYYESVKNKKEVLTSIMNELGLVKDEVASIGDDMNDLSMFAISGLTFTPNDGSRYLHNKVDVVLESKGGDGAVREMIEYIFKRDGLEEQFLQLWE